MYVVYIDRSKSQGSVSKVIVSVYMHAEMHAIRELQGLTRHTALLFMHTALLSYDFVILLIAK